MPRSKAFTLIELLIVVAIIGILAAIAVPNFRNALTRSKIAAVQGEFVSLGLAMEMYRADYSVYFWGTHLWPIALTPQPGSEKMTTPVAYTSFEGMTDRLLYPAYDEKRMVEYAGEGWVPPFMYGILVGGIYRYRHENHNVDFNTTSYRTPIEEFYILHTAGPDRHISIVGLSLHKTNPSTNMAGDGIIPYDVSNGLYSEGEIVRTQGIAYRPDLGYIPSDSFLTPLYYKPPW